MTKGEEKAWQELFRVFAGEKRRCDSGKYRNSGHDTAGYQ